MSPCTTLENAKQSIPLPDVAAIRTRFRASGRMLTPWARAKGLNTDIFRQFMSNKINPTGQRVHPTYDSIVAKLREDNLWAELPPKTMPEDVQRAA